MLDPSQIAHYGSFLEVAFAINLISTWEGFYRYLGAKTKKVEAGKVNVTDELFATFVGKVDKLKRFSKLLGLALAFVIALLLLYGLPKMHSALILLLLWVCGGALPLLAIVLYVMASYYYPSKMYEAAANDKQAVEDARARLVEDRMTLDQAQIELHILRPDNNNEEKPES